MSIRVDPDWWKKIFDDIYLLTDARSVCDPSITCHEVDLLCNLLSLKSGHRILDLCGGHGRHSIELYSRGITGCTIVDFSQFLIGHAKKHADRLGFRIDCIRADARKTRLPDESFDYVIIMGNSLGYIAEPVADRDILLEANRLLQPEGKVLVDVVNGNSLRDSFNPNAWHEINTDIIVCRHREMCEGRVNTHEIIISKSRGLIRDQTYSIRFYDLVGLTDLLEKSGFGHVSVITDFSPHEIEGDYGCMNLRMVAIGQKA